MKSKLYFSRMTKTFVFMVLYGTMIEADANEQCGDGSLTCVPDPQCDGITPNSYGTCGDGTRDGPGCSNSALNEYDGKFFFTSPSSLTLNECEEFCASRVAQMPCIEDKEMNDFVRSLSSNAWVGLNYNEELGDFEWSDPTCNSNYTNWIWENVALFKPATQSTTSSSGTEAYRAVDGNTCGQSYCNIATTLYETNPWWRVDLQDDFVVSQVELYNTEYWYDQSQLRDAIVTLLDENDSILAQKQYNGYSRVMPVAFDDVPGTRKVKVELAGSSRRLNLAEVFVFSGSKKGTGCSTFENTGRWDPADECAAKRNCICQKNSLSDAFGECSCVPTNTQYSSHMLNTCKDNKGRIASKSCANNTGSDACLNNVGLIDDNSCNHNGQDVCTYNGQQGFGFIGPDSCNSNFGQQSVCSWNGRNGFGEVEAGSCNFGKGTGICSRNGYGGTSQIKPGSCNGGETYTCYGGGNSGGNSIIGIGSCNNGSSRTCYSSGSGSGNRAYIGDGSCNDGGSYTCAYSGYSTSNAETSIGDGSCNGGGSYACSYSAYDASNAETSIGNDSCNGGGQHVCSYNGYDSRNGRAHIGYGSCNNGEGSYVCSYNGYNNYNGYSLIGNFSCNGGAGETCRYNGYNSYGYNGYNASIGSHSCNPPHPNGTYTCRMNQGIIEDNACNGVGACNSIGRGAIIEEYCCNYEGACNSVSSRISLDSPQCFPPPITEDFAAVSDTFVWEANEEDSYDQNSFLSVGSGSPQANSISLFHFDLRSIIDVFGIISHAELELIDAGSDAGDIPVVAMLVDKSTMNDTEIDWTNPLADHLQIGTGIFDAENGSLNVDFTSILSHAIIPDLYFALKVPKVPSDGGYKVATFHSMESYCEDCRPKLQITYVPLSNIEEMMKVRTDAPSQAPSTSPSSAPSGQPSSNPSSNPSPTPSKEPSIMPSVEPSTSSPSLTPSHHPSFEVENSLSPSSSFAPSPAP